MPGRVCYQKASIVLSTDEEEVESEAGALDAVRQQLTTARPHHLQSSVRSSFSLPHALKVYTERRQAPSSTTVDSKGPNFKSASSTHEDESKLPKTSSIRRRCDRNETAAINGPRELDEGEVSTEVQLFVCVCQYLL
jgi:hypothetical protein